MPKKNLMVVQQQEATCNNIKAEGNQIVISILIEIIFGLYSRLSETGSLRHNGRPKIIQPNKKGEILVRVCENSEYQTFSKRY